MKITRNQLKGLVKEVLSEQDSEYQEFFKRALEKAGKSIPQMSDEEKKEFFNKIDAAWQGKGEKNESVNEDDTVDLPGRIPSSIKSKLDLAISKISGESLSYPQKLLIVGYMLSAMGIDKTELMKMSSKLKTALESVNEAKVIVYNEKTGERYEVLSGNGKGDLMIAMKALQKAAPSHMKYSIKESVNEASILKTKAKSDADISKVASILKSKNIKYTWSAEMGDLMFNNDSDKKKAKSILGTKWIEEGLKESVNEGTKPKFKVGDVVKYKGAKISAKVLKVIPTNWENRYLIQFQDNKKKEEAGESSLVKESVNEDSNEIVGKTVFSDGKGRLFFGYYKEDDSVYTVDYKTWTKLNMKDVSKGDTNKDKVINAILRNQKQFNKKVDYNMWAKKAKPSFEEKMYWFILNNWISNITKAGIKE